MITDLPWQLLIVVVEIWVSAVVAMLIINKRFYLYTWRNVWWSLSDLGIITLLVWGGNPSWQHGALAFLYGWAIFTRIRKTFRGHVQEMKPNENEGAQAFGLVLLATILTLLVVTG